MSPQTKNEKHSEVDVPLGNASQISLQNMQEKIIPQQRQDFFFTWNLEIYVERQLKNSNNIDASPGKVIIRLVLNIGRNLALDNNYPSLDLTEDLLQKKIALVCTIRKNKGKSPKEFNFGKNRGQYSSLFGNQKNMTGILCPKEK